MTKPSPYNLDDLITYDIECYPNYLLIHFKDGDERFIFEAWDNDFDSKEIDKLERRIKHRTVVGWNNHHYDDHLLSALLGGWDDNSRFHELSTEIIVSNDPSWRVTKRHGIAAIDTFEVDSVDCMQIIPGRIGLKIAGARIHHPVLMELPLPPDTLIQSEHLETMRFYCANDVDITEKNVVNHMPQFHLRQDLSDKYKIDLRSKGDAAIANLVIGKEYARLQKTSLKKLGKQIDRHPGSFRYTPPHWVKTDNAVLQALIDELKTIDFETAESGAVAMPEQLKDRVVTIGDRSYAFGIGGLHSIDSNGAWYADDEYCLIDLDVVSFYPFIMLLGEFYPRHMGKEYLKIYKNIVDRRVKAKKRMGEIIKEIEDKRKQGDKQKIHRLREELTEQQTDTASLKLVANSTFGQTSQKYSNLYDPSLTLHTTVTGQLSLLILVDQLEKAGIHCISANTDGVTFRIHKDDIPTMEEIAKRWEESSGFNLERADYKVLSKRDVNSYIAITTDGKAKTKGALSPSYDIQHNPSGNVILNGIIAGLQSNSKSAIEDHILSCFDLTEFIFIRRVKGGAVDTEGNPLGGILRWYYSSNTPYEQTLNYIKTGNKVPDSEGCQPVVDLPNDFPDDIDYERYIRAAYKIWDDITTHCKTGRNLQAQQFRDMGLTPVPATHTGRTVVPAGYDFSITENYATQTGEQAGLMALSVTDITKQHKTGDRIAEILDDSDTYRLHDWFIFKFKEPGWPASLSQSAASKSFHYRYGQAIPFLDSIPVYPLGILELPEELRELVYSACPANVRRRIDEKNLL